MKGQSISRKYTLIYYHSHSFSVFVYFNRGLYNRGLSVPCCSFWKLDGRGLFDRGLFDRIPCYIPVNEAALELFRLLQGRLVWHYCVFTHSTEYSKATTGFFLIVSNMSLYFSLPFYLSLSLFSLSLTLSLSLSHSSPFCLIPHIFLSSILVDRVDTSYTWLCFIHMNS